MRSTMSGESISPWGARSDPVGDRVVWRSSIRGSVGSTTVRKSVSPQIVAARLGHVVDLEVWRRSSVRGSMGSIGARESVSPWVAVARLDPVEDREAWWRGMGIRSEV